MKSVMNQRFSNIPPTSIPRSTFKRSHGHKTTFDAGYLIPIFVDEALPGDTMQMKMSAFARLATPLHPFMDNMHLDTFFFAVPNRLVWDNWQKFNGEQTNPGDSTDYIIPTMTAPLGGHLGGSLSDHMGIPTLVEGLEHSCLPHRAYSLILNEWFRDQNLQDSIPIDTGDGPDLPTDHNIYRRGKRHDYFTSALPWPQKGEEVLLPIGDRAPVSGLYARSEYASAGATDVYSAVGETINTGTTPVVSTFYTTENPDLLGYPEIFADLTAATASTINQIREAFQIQKMYERDARGGTRYVELLRSHFGVISADARLQRPEYLGGGSSAINVNPVAQTSQTDTTPQGNLAAMGTASFSGHGFNKSFEEHTILIGIVNVRADLTYQQGLDRMWSRKTRFDHYWPSFAHLGEQPVLNKEIYAQGTLDPIADEAVFGYQERFAEYRYKNSQITGKFRSNDPLTLDTWHLSQDFQSLPLLNSTFIQDNPPVERVIATVDEPHLLFDSYFEYKCTRPMPTYSVPGMVDHF